MSEFSSFKESMSAIERMQKSNFALCGIPLALLASQMRLLLSLDSFWTKLLITFSFATLGVALFIVLLQYSQFMNWQIKNLLIYEESKVSVETKGIRFVENLLKLSGHDRLTEDSLINSNNNTIKWVAFLVFLGYISFISLIINVLWGGP